MTEPTSAPRTARERARAELTAEIVESARQHLAVEGAAGLSLRAVARDLGMVSSAIYRYFPSRDDLLTRLIIDAYNASATPPRRPRRRSSGPTCVAAGSRSCTARATGRWRTRRSGR